MASMFVAPFRGLTGYFHSYTQEQFENDLNEANKRFDLVKIKETLDKLSSTFAKDKLINSLSQSLMIFCLSSFENEDLAYIDLLLNEEIQRNFKSQEDQNYIMALLSSSTLRSIDVNITVLEKLLNSKIDPNNPDKKGALPLEIATNSEYAKLLLNYGADPNKLGSLNCPPLYHVLKNKGFNDESIKIIELLIYKGAKDMEWEVGYSKIKLSDSLDLKEFKGKDLLVSTLKKNANRNGEDLKLSNLIHLDNQEETKQASLSKERCIFFYKNKKEETVRVEFLLEPPIKDNISVEDVMKFNNICNPQIFDDFIDEEIKENVQKIYKSYPYLLHQALFQICGHIKDAKQLKIASILLENGANPNFRFEEGNTPLTEICEKINEGNDCFDELQLLQMLLENKADVNIFYMWHEKIQWPEEKDKLKFHSCLTEGDITSWLERHCIAEESIKLICFDEKVQRSVLDLTFHPKAVEVLTKKYARFYGMENSPFVEATRRLREAQDNKNPNKKLISHLTRTKAMYEEIRFELKPIAKKS